MNRPWKDGKPLSVSAISLMAHEIWPVPDPYRLPEISFCLDDGSLTDESKEIIMRELIRGAIRGENMEVVSGRIGREIDRQVGEFLDKMNNMLKYGTYEGPQ